MRIALFLLSFTLIALTGLCGISYRVDSPALFHSETALTLYLERGWVCLSRQPENRLITTGRSIEYLEQWDWYPFSERKNLIARFPLNFPIALCLGFLCYYWVLPAYRRRRRVRAGLICAECGYLLKGLTEPRCPECNTRFPRSALGGPDTDRRVSSVDDLP